LIKRKRFIIPLLVSGVLLLIALSVYIARLQFDTTLAFTLRDRVGKHWVWDAKITIQNRVIRSFYQSDRGPVEYKFTGLEEGEATLSITAPNYQAVSLPVDLSRRENRIEEPIELIGYEIPGLSHFIVFEEWENRDLLLELRPVGEDGTAIINHPCLDLWIGVKLSAQVKDGAYVREPTEEGSYRGEELFLGKAEWEWDPSPETIFRYHARISSKKISSTRAPYWVMDYLIIVPDPRQITTAEIDSFMQKAPQFNDEEELIAFLESGKDKFRYFFDTLWNIEGRVD